MIANFRIMDEEIINMEAINRIEVINHAKNDKPIGRLLVLYKELGHFEEVEFSVQDDGQTLKIFLK